MEPLAWTDDYEEFTGLEATTQVGALLESASAKVRRYLGQTISYVEDDEIIVRPRNGVARLPQRPVTDVSEVVRNGTTLDADSYAWTRQGLLYGPDNINRFDLDLIWGCVPLTVTYSHGYEDIPADLVELVINLASRGVQSPGNVRQESETIGSYTHSVTYGTPSFSADDLSVLSFYKMPAGAIDTYPSWV